MRRVRGVLLALVVVGAVAVRAEVIDRIVATIDGEPITAVELERYRREVGEQPVSDQALLDAVITERLLEKEATARGIEASDADVDAYLGEIKKRNALDDAAFATALQGQGLTVETYRERVKGEILRSQLVAREIRGRVSISDEAIERYYKEHREQYRTGGGVTVRDIFLRVPPDADDAEVARIAAEVAALREQAGSKRAFIRIAKEKSELPGASDEGGLLGTFKPGQMDEALDKAVFALEAGEVSQPVRTADGFHVLRVDEVVDADYRPLDDVRDEIRDKLYSEALEQRYQEWITKDLRERHHVEVIN